jgi:hypothetical protein
VDIGQKEAAQLTLLEWQRKADLDEPKMTVTNFVRGLAWHDVGKPFALGGAQHALLSYWLLNLAGYSQEALVALAHEGKGSWRQYLVAKGTGATLPALLLLGNPLDRLAASVYSLFEQRLETAIHSRQNPFSRLPVEIERLKKLFVISHDRLSANLETPWWETLCDHSPQEWKMVFSSEKKASVVNQEQLPLDIAPLPAGMDALRVIRQAMDDYPERTYPPMNDTSLAQHCRLSGILGFVVYRNLKQSTAQTLTAEIGFQNGAVQPPDLKGDAKQPSGYKVEEAIVQAYAATSLVRITFTGVQTQVQEAVRVDDLHGALMLARYFREAFKEMLAKQLSVPDLAEWLPISESQFDLIYLLPGEVTDVREDVRQAYTEAVRQVTTRIFDKRLRRDFPEIGSQQDELVRQLSRLAYGVHVIPVELPKGNDFNAFAAAYGRKLLKLLKVYTQSQQDAPTEFPTVADDERARLTASETCEVCGNNPVLMPPEDLDRKVQAEWLKKRDYAAHTFREEREHLCLSCVARRTLAYGAVAKRMDDLTHAMFEPVPGKLEMWRRVQPQNGPSLPPQMSATVQLTASEELRDVGAFYARFRRTADGVDRTQLDLFPTTTYAADGYGNVVLLALQPTRVLYEPYIYQQALTAWESKPADPDDVVKGWQQTFVDFYKQQKTDNPSFAQTIERVEPHLARVMERIQWIKRFYVALEDALIAEQVRVLPLDVNFPTLRLLIPADQLDQTLRVLDRVVTESLFSATYHENWADRQEAHKLLKLILPKLLHGAAVLFKQKFPLYLALEAERDVFHQLAASDSADSMWYGFWLGFSDLRGSLSEVGPLHAEVTYGNLGEVLYLVEKVDRRTVMQYAETAEYISPALAEAQALVRTRQVRELHREHIEALSDEENKLFPPVHFIKRAIRR